MTKVVSGGIELPHRIKSDIAPEEIQSTELAETELIEHEAPNDTMIERVSCPNCSASFRITKPEADKAVVGCPSCSQDFILRFT